MIHFLLLLIKGTYHKVPEHDEVTAVPELTEFLSKAKQLDNFGWLMKLFIAQFAQGFLKYL